MINSLRRGAPRVKANWYKVKEPPVPVERLDTIRHRIVSMLLAHPSTARQMSADLRIPEREIYDHLEHIRKTMHTGTYRLVVQPATCERCGFTFRKRERLKKPGRCPLCRSELIAEPLFAVVEAKLI
jgi:predicted Zn-ribbon and HTH transcriptional regulator